MMIVTEKTDYTFYGIKHDLLYGYDTDNKNFAFVAILNYNISAELTATNDVYYNEKQLIQAINNSRSYNGTTETAHNLAIFITIQLEKLKEIWDKPLIN